MTPFPELDKAQERFSRLIKSYATDLDDDARALIAVKACRTLTQILQVREEIVHPFCVNRAPSPLIDAFIIEDDLMRVLIGEIVAGHPSDLLYDGLVAVLAQAVRRRWSAEASAGGLWSRIPKPPAHLELSLEDRLRELEADEDWSPLMPVGLETLRSSVPAGATRWVDL